MGCRGRQVGWSTLLLAVLFTTGRPATAQSAPAQRVTDCLVTLERRVELSAQHAGMLTLLQVEVGDQVEQDQLLGLIDERAAKQQEAVAAAELEAAESEAQNELRVQAAVKTAELAAQELKIMEQIRESNPGAISPLEISKQQLKMEHARLEVLVARRAVALAVITMKAKEAQHRLASLEVQDRRLTAPFRGLVTSVRRKQGEWVSQGEPMLRIISIDRLLIEGYVDAALHSPREIANSRVQADVLLTRGKRHKTPCTIRFVSPEIEPNNSFRVVVEIDNSERKFFPGMSADLLFWTSEAEAELDGN
ncbi:Macrolide export protein MacA [Lignipirellula cremea]|uniref:Macrolide export protein MacA n=2 Tax=Lignipirellula cremea TaxID=2528010 RepID=A0A518DRU0_9BACT|nr:Macrolide export protein MacA [Lignipirellula cremea]